MTVLQAAEMHNCGSDFVVEIELGMHLHWIVKVGDGFPRVAEE